MVNTIKSEKENNNIKSLNPSSYSFYIDLFQVKKLNDYTLMHLEFSFARLLRYLKCTVF